MFKALLRKQFGELFSSLMQNRKNGKQRSKAAVAGLGLLFLFCFVSVSFAFVGISYLMADMLLPMRLDWLYFTMALIQSLAVGVIGSIFMTYSALYQAKDNELLLSMPIPPLAILGVRMVSIGTMSLLFTAMTWLPAVLVYALNAHPGIGTVLCGIAMLFVITALVIVLSCILGWLVGLAVSRLRNKNIMTMILSVAGLGIYYFFCFNMTDILTGILAKGQLLAESIQKDLWILYEAGQASLGQGVPLLICVGLALAALLVTAVILSRSFDSIVTNNRGTKQKVYREQKMTSGSPDQALLRKEMNRFTSSTAYMMNCGMGILMMLAGSVLLIVKAGDVNNLFLLLDQVPELRAWIIPAAGALLALLISMVDVTAPSISLEAKNLWILQSMPVDLRRVLNAKQKLHLLLGLPVTLIMAVVMGLVLRANVPEMIVLVLFGATNVFFGSAWGLAMNLKFPNLRWVNETAAVKQGTSVFLGLFGGWVLILLLAGLGYLLRNMLSPFVYFCCATGIMILLTAGLNLWIRKRGPEILGSLSA